MIREDFWSVVRRLPIPLALAGLAPVQAARAIVAFYRGQLFECRAMLDSLERTGANAGMDPVVAAVATVEPRSALVKDFHATRATFASLVKDAERRLDRWTPRLKSAADLGRLTGIVKAAERVLLQATLFCDPAPRMPLGDPFVPLQAEGNLLDALNAAYYRKRGAGIYRDFATKAERDALLAQADARHFVREAPGRPARVLEAGVGNGIFAADFLDTLRGEAGSAAGVRYTLADLSPKMLRDAIGSARLGRHRRALEIRALPQAFRRHYALQRFHELLTDLPRCAILYVDRAGRLHYAEVRASWPAGKPPPCKTPLVVGSLGRLSLTALTTIGWELRFVETRAAALPYGDLARRLLRGRRDLVLPFNIGAAEFLEHSLSALPPRGRVRIFDYGFAKIPSAQPYSEAARVIRRFGAQPTRDALFPLLRAVAARRGCRTRLVTQEEFIEETLGRRPIEGWAYAGLRHRARLSQPCSGPGAPLPLRRLRAYPVLRRRGRAFLERLATDLDFEINGALRDLVLRAAEGGAAWIADPADLIEAGRRLEAIGFKLDGGLRVPPWGRLWVLEVESNGGRFLERG